MSSIMQILRRIGGAKAPPTSGSAGQLAIYKAGTAATDATSLYAHDGTQWVELLDTSHNPRVITANDAVPGLRITQAGAGHALLVEDEANPDATPFVVSERGQVSVGFNPPSGTDLLAKVFAEQEAGASAFMSGVVVLGTPNMPNYTFSGQNGPSGGGKGTGMYLKASDVLAFSTGGIEHLRIDDKGDTFATGDIGNTGQIIGGKGVNAWDDTGIGAALYTGTDPLVPGAVRVGCSTADRVAKLDNCRISFAGGNVSFGYTGDPGQWYQVIFTKENWITCSRYGSTLDINAVGGKLAFHYNAGLFYNYNSGAWVNIAGPSSDRRLKRVLPSERKAMNYSSIVSALNPVRYEFTQRADMALPSEPRYGFVAQEVQEILPEAVTTFSLPSKLPDGTEVPDAPKDMLRFSEDGAYQLLAVVIGALKEANAKIDALEKRIAVLEGRP